MANGRQPRGGYQPEGKSTDGGSPPRGGSGVPRESRRKSRPKPDRKPKHGKGMLVTGGVDGGRPPDEFKRKMRELASADDVLKYLQRCLRGKYGAKVAVAAHRHITERGYGKVPIEVSGPDGSALLFKVYQGVDPDAV